MEKIPSKRNARPSVFGFEFQVITGLILTLNNIKNVKSIAIEGPLEDIEIELNNGKFIYAQAKSIVNPLNGKGNSDKFREGLTTLDEVSKEDDVEKLIYVSNTYYPLGKKEINSPAYWPLSASTAVFSYTELKDTTKINDFILPFNENNPDFDLDKFEIHFYKFMDVENKETRYALIYEKINDFLGKIDMSYTPYRGEIFDLWYSRFQITQVNKQSLSKNDFLWPLIVKLTEKIKHKSEFIDYFDIDHELVIEVSQVYHSMIEGLTNSFETSNLIINEYNDSLKSDELNEFKGSEKYFQFISKRWRMFQKNIFIGDDPEIERLVVRLVMWRILTSKRLINKVKEEGGL